MFVSGRQVVFSKIIVLGSAIIVLELNLLIIEGGLNNGMGNCYRSFSGFDVSYS